MNYPSYETRTPRATFTKKLQALADKLSKCNTKEVPYGKNWFRDSGTETVTVKAMWVVGSYARGALTCGDLDVVIDTQAIRCTEAGLIKAMLGLPRDVRAYLGTPEENTSHVEFDEAVKIWEPGMDWKAAIAKIQEDPKAGRFERESDEIPFRTEQLKGMSFDKLDRILGAHQAGLIEWEFVPFDSLTPKELTNERVLRFVSDLGVERQALLPYVQCYLEGKALRSVDQRLSDGVWTYGGAEVHLGRCSLLDFSKLDTPKVSEVVFMPFLNSRGPNGLWVIRRGPCHPLRKVAERLQGWVEHNDGIAYPSAIGCPEHSGYSADTLNVFRDEQAFQAYLDCYAKDADPEDLPGELLLLTGESFLEALGGLDGIEVWNDGFFFWDGAEVLGHPNWDGTDLRGHDLAQRLADAVA